MQSRWAEAPIEDMEGTGNPVTITILSSVNDAALSAQEQEVFSHLPFVALNEVEEKKRSVVYRTHSTFWSQQALLSDSVQGHQGSVICPVENHGYCVVPRSEAPEFMANMLLLMDQDPQDLKVQNEELVDLLDLPQCQYRIDCAFQEMPKKGPEIPMIDIDRGRIRIENVDSLKYPDVMRNAHGMRAVVGYSHWIAVRKLYPTISPALCLRCDDGPQYFKTSVTNIGSDRVVIVVVYGQSSDVAPYLSEYPWPARVQRLILADVPRRFDHGLLDPRIFRDASRVGPVVVCVRKNGSIASMDVQKMALDFTESKPRGCRVWIVPYDLPEEAVPFSVSGLAIEGDILLDKKLGPYFMRDDRLSVLDLLHQCVQLFNRYTDNYGLDLGEPAIGRLLLTQFSKVEGEKKKVAEGNDVEGVSTLSPYTPVATKVGRTYWEDCMDRDQPFFQNYWREIARGERRSPTLFCQRERPTQKRVACDIGVVVLPAAREFPDLRVFQPIRESFSVPIYFKSENDYVNGVLFAMSQPHKLERAKYHYGRLYRYMMNLKTPLGMRAVIVVEVLDGGAVLQALTRSDLVAMETKVDPRVDYYQD